MYDIDSLKSTRKLLASLPVMDLAFIMEHSGNPRFAIGADEQSRAIDFRFDDARGRWNKIEKDAVRRYRPLQASFGAYASMMLAARDSTLYKCAVGYVGVYDLKLLAKPENNRNDTVKAITFRKYVGDDKAELDRNSPVMLASRIKAPVLLIHGGKDKRAPVEHAHAMRAALIKANRPPEWFLAPNEGHGFYDTANRTAFFEKLEAFLGKHIGQGAAAK